MNFGNIKILRKSLKFVKDYQEHEYKFRTLIEYKNRIIYMLVANAIGLGVEFFYKAKDVTIEF